MNLPRVPRRRFNRETAASIGAALATVYPPDAAGDRQLEATLNRLNTIPATGQPAKGA